MPKDDLLTVTEQGLYCPAGGFHIDPWCPVERAVITHAHSDHARAGSRRYLASRSGADVLRVRLGPSISVDAVDWGEVIDVHGVRVSLHPAGHVLGSAQVRVEHGGRVWVVTGDYKRAADATCERFEVVPCDVFITESTFGLPIYRWREPGLIAAELNAWWRGNAERGRTSVVTCYALGKAQRVLSLLDPAVGPILTHGAIRSFDAVYAAHRPGVLPAAEHATREAIKAAGGRAMVLCPPGAVDGPWGRALADAATAMASGWMAIRGPRRRRALDHGFVLSDHVDWPDLLRTVEETGAERVGVTHGYTGPVVRWLRERGREAWVVPTRFGDEEGESEEVECAEGALLDGVGEEFGKRVEGEAVQRAPDRRAPVRHRAGGLVAPGDFGRAGSPLHQVQPEAFTRLYLELDATNRTAEKTAALERYFRAAEARDAVWALACLTGRRLRRAVSGPELFGLAAKEAGLPGWLMEECFAAVGDGGETVALLLPEPAEVRPIALHELLAERIARLRRMSEAERGAAIVAIWRRLDAAHRFVFHKLLSGTFRVGVSRTLAVRALANVVGVPPAEMEGRVMGDWEPTEATWARLTSAEVIDGEPSRPYPFFLAQDAEAERRKRAAAGEAAGIGEVLGARDQWQAEWKWDGLRGQLIRRGGKSYLWSRGEEPIGRNFPELLAAAEALPEGTVLDGEVLAVEGERVRSFAELQPRINRVQAEGLLFTDNPVAFVAYDVLEAGGVDVRGRTLRERRGMLEEIVPGGARAAGGAAGMLRVSPVVEAATWEELGVLRAGSRERGVEGLMLKRLDSAYGTGRTGNAWWKWKIDPHTVDAVLMFAQPGSGRRASLFTDYTFGVWDRGKLVPCAKAYSGLTDAEIAELDRWIRRHTVERHGPVAVVEPVQVFELAFEAIARSDRHRSGVALRFPRMARWRKDKRAEEADGLEVLEKLMS